MYTWGISGPRFLLLYLVLLAVTVLGVVLARRRALAADGAAVPARLDPYEAAELNGGGFLVATTAVSGLLRKGSLTSSSRRRNQPARLVAATAPGPGAHPVEWAVYQQVAASPNRRLKDVQAALEQAPALAAVRERLQLGRLAPTPEQRARCRAAVLWFLPLLALGVARVAAGSANGRPVGFLVTLLIATVVVAAAFLRVPNATDLGRRTLLELRAANPRPTAGASPAQLSMGTALFGAGVLWAADTDTALLLSIRREHGAFGGEWGGGGGDGGGGGGGCGGGGCGGGGCGG
jgi:uncharacterized protein (TIGR04222 family)